MSSREIRFWAPRRGHPGPGTVAGGVGAEGSGGQRALPAASRQGQHGDAPRASPCASPPSSWASHLLETPFLPISGLNPPSSSWPTWPGMLFSRLSPLPHAHFVTPRSTPCPSVSTVCPQERSESPEDEEGQSYRENK